jgi:hypothetical protein
MEVKSIMTDVADYNSNVEVFREREYPMLKGKSMI